MDLSAVIPAHNEAQHLDKTLLVIHTNDHPSHRGWRAGSVRSLVPKKPPANKSLDRDQLLQANVARLEQHA
jgi:hypothetical protein